MYNRFVGYAAHIFRCFYISRGDLLSLFLTLSVANLEPTSGIADVIDHFTIIQESDFDAQHFNKQAKIIASCQKVSDLSVKKHKQ